MRSRLVFILLTDIPHKVFIRFLAHDQGITHADNIRLNHDLFPSPTTCPLLLYSLAPVTFCRYRFVFVYKFTDEYSQTIYMLYATYHDSSDVKLRDDSYIQVSMTNTNTS